jgi:hypothetical protein
MKKMTDRQKAVNDIYELQKGMEAKPYSRATVEKRVFFDKTNGTYRMIGKGYDYTA